MRKPKGFFEPWTAEPKRLPVARVDTSNLSPEDRAEVEAILEQGRQSSEYVVWGSRMAEPGAVTGLLGQTSVFDDRHVVVFVTNPVCPDSNKVTAKQIAERIAGCVTACRNVASPVETLDGVRDLLRDLALGDADASDPRVVALLSRLIPHDQAARFMMETEDEV